MKLNKYISLGLLSLAVGFSSCVGDLNVEPTNPTQQTELTSKEDYLGLLAGIYYGLTSGDGVSFVDGGASVYIRQLFNQQVLTTDECFTPLSWNDAGLPDMVYAIPNADNGWLYCMFSRINYQISHCNLFIRTIQQATDFFTDTEIQQMQAEARVLRDFSYYHMIDIFGKGPFTDENSLVGPTPPTYSRQELYDFVVADLNDAIPMLVPAAQQQYGRISREAGLALLAKIYLNAGVYTGTPQWQACANTCLEITKTIPNLATEYKYLFCGSNKKYVASQDYGTTYGEILWCVPADPDKLQSWGGMVYQSAGAWSNSYPTEKWGLQTGQGWQGPAMRPETVRRFEANDKRALFFDAGGNFSEDLITIDSREGEVSCGIQCIKFVYTEEDDYDNDYNTYFYNDASRCPIDAPVFRLADIYLMLAECQLNGASCDGLNYYNKVRTRAGVAAVGSYTAQDLLDERNRELYWECQRRSDLIRFGQYTGSVYNWQWKAGVQEGGSLESFRNLMPIPTQFTPTLGQNPGY